MNCLHLPFFTELDHARIILLAGAGGGFDIFSGLPLYFGLRDAGKQVHLANLSFSSRPRSCRPWRSITATTTSRSEQREAPSGLTR